MLKSYNLPIPFNLSFLCVPLKIMDWFDNYNSTSNKIEEMILHQKNAVLIDHKNHKRTIQQIESYETNGK